MEPLPQLVALKRPELPEIVRPEPREIVEDARPGSLKLETAVVSLPANAENSKVRICENPEGTKARRKTKTARKPSKPAPTEQRPPWGRGDPPAGRVGHEARGDVGQASRLPDPDPIAGGTPALHAGVFGRLGEPSLPGQEAAEDGWRRTYDGGRLSKFVPNSATGGVAWRAVDGREVFTGRRWR